MAKTRSRIRNPYDGTIWVSISGTEARRAFDKGEVLLLSPDKRSPFLNRRPSEIVKLFAQKTGPRVMLRDFTDNYTSPQCPIASKFMGAFYMSADRVEKLFEVPKAA